ncbi:MAG: DUF2726 domain-containing protein [Planctomycetia bacterium]|nr:DUF2726 domain-containing protein [Planctomycetia bacterium]
MTIFFIALVVLAVVLVFVQSAKKQGRKVTENAVKVADSSGDLVFSQRLLFTKNENEFFNYLRSFVPEGYEVWGKLGLWAVVHCADKRGWAKISQKQLDFVIVSVGPVPSAVLVIELDDASHKRKTAQARDAEKDKILVDAGIPVLRFPVCDFAKTDFSYKILEALNVEKSKI